MSRSIPIAFGPGASSEHAYDPMGPRIHLSGVAEGSVVVNHLPVSTVVIAYNNEPNIRAYLESTT